MREQVTLFSWVAWDVRRPTPRIMHGHNKLQSSNPQPRPSGGRSPGGWLPGTGSRGIRQRCALCCTVCQLVSMSELCPCGSRSPCFHGWPGMSEDRPPASCMGTTSCNPATRSRDPQGEVASLKNHPGWWIRLVVGTQ